MDNKSFTRPILMAVLALTSVFAAAGTQSFQASPAAHKVARDQNKSFQIRIVDQMTRKGVPHVRLTTDNGIICYTGPDGNVTWSESSLMDRNVYFKIESSGYVFPGGGKLIRVTHGARVELQISR